MSTFTQAISRRLFVGLAAAASIAVQAPAAWAQDAWPSRPIKFLVPAPAGGTSDIVARAVAETMSKNIGQPVIVDDRPGGMGAIAVDAFLAAPRDGYTIIFAPSSLVTEVPYTIKPKYDPMKDLVPLVDIATIGLVLVANTSLPIKNLPDMIAYVKSHPGQVNFASYSPGTISHVKGLQLNKVAGLDMQHVGYRGTPPALQDVMSGQVQFMFDGIATSLPNIRGGKLRALAVTLGKRSAVLPDVPTLAELGYPDLTQTVGMGFWTTPDVPANVQGRLRAELLKVLGNPALRDRLVSYGLDPAAATQSVDDIRKSLSLDYERTGQILRSINYKPE